MLAEMQVRNPDRRNSCADEFNYLLVQLPWRHTVYPCFRLYVLPPPLLSLHPSHAIVHWEPVMFSQGDHVSGWKD